MPNPALLTSSASRGSRGQALGDAVDILEAGEVGRQASAAMPWARGEFRGELFETVAAAGDQQQVVALGRELAGEYRAQPGGGPGDRSNTVWHRGSIVRFGHDRDAPELARRLVPALALRPGGGPAAGARAGWSSTSTTARHGSGSVPFYITGLTLPYAPAIPYLSNFPETNVRTYARDRTGGRGVWFFSLDAARLLAVVGARAGYALPYFWSRMRVACDGRTARYSSERLHRPKASSDVEVRDRRADRGAERAGKLPDDAIPAVCRARRADLEGRHRASAVAAAARERGPAARHARAGGGVAGAGGRGADALCEAGGCEGRAAGPAVGWERCAFWRVRGKLAMLNGVSGAG